MGITIGKAIPVHWVNTTYTSVDVIGSGGVYTGMGGSRTFRECKPGVNQWGQAGASITYTNDSNKEIKYIVFTVVPLDSVNSRLSVPVRLQETGPIKPHAIKSCQWDYMWQAGSLKRIIVESVTIEYMDGTFEEQAIQPGKNQTLLQYDPAAGYSMTLPIVLSALAAAFMFFSIRADIRFIGLHILFMALSLLTAVLSKKGKRIVSVVLAAEALIAHTVSYLIPAARVMVTDAGIVDGTVAEASSVVGNYSFPLDAGAVGVMVMCLLMLLCAMGAIKENKKVIMPVAFGILCAATIIPGVMQLVQKGNAGGLFLSVLYILFGALIWMVAIRCRHTLAIGNGNTVSAKLFEAAGDQNSGNRRTEEFNGSAAPFVQPVRKELSAKETSSGNASSKIYCKNCGALNNPGNEECFACHARLRDHSVSPENKPDKFVAQPAEEKQKSAPEKQILKQKTGLSADSGQRDNTAGKMHCPKCGAVNDIGNESCVACHASFDLLKAFMEAEVVPKKKKTVFCPKCGAINDAENDQCTECNVSFELLKAFMDAGDSVPQDKTGQAVETTEPGVTQEPELLDSETEAIEDTATASMISPKEQPEEKEILIASIDPDYSETESEEEYPAITLPDKEKEEKSDNFTEPELPKERDKATEIAGQNFELKKKQIEKKGEEPVPAWFSEITKEHNSARREIQRELDASIERTRNLVQQELQGQGGKSRRKGNETANARREEELRQDELRKKLAEEDARYQAEIEKRKQGIQE